MMEDVTQNAFERISLDFIKGLLEASRHCLWAAEIRSPEEYRNEILDICAAVDKCIDKIDSKETNEK